MNQHSFPYQDNYREEKKRAGRKDRFLNSDW